MKLTENHEVTKLPENNIYTALQSIFHDVCCDIPECAMNNASFSDQGFVYAETEEEKKFWNERYMNLSNNDQYSKIVNDYSFKKLNKQEYDLIDYTFDFKKKILILTGRQGWGKTTLLRRVFFHLLPNCNTNNILPIYISFNRHINRFAVGAERFEELFYNLLSNNVRKYTATVLGSLDNDFFEFLREAPEHSEFDLSLRLLEDQCKKGRLDPAQKANEITTLQREELKKSTTALYCLQYIHKKLNVNPICIFDDLDPLQYDFIRWLYNETCKLTREYEFRIILAMRPNTHGQIAKYGTLHIISPTFVNVEFPKCEVFLSNKLTAFRNEVTEHKSRGIIVGDKNITPSNLNTFLLNYCKILSSDDAQSFLKNVSGGDLRRLESLIRTYLSSGHIRPEKIISNLFALNPSSDSLPTWIVYTSIITNNYPSVFPYTITNEDEFIINLFCNGKGYTNTYLIRLHILSYFCREHKRVFYLKEFLERYSPLIKGDNSSLQYSVTRALRRFNNAGLITNDLFLYIDRRERINEIEEFTLLPLGTYYISELLTKFEYISYMKDDVDYTDNKHETYGIRNCIEVKEHHERFKETVNFLRFFCDEEWEFVSKLSKEGWENYITYFSPQKDTYLFSSRLINRLITYGQRRGFDIHELEKLHTASTAFIQHGANKEN